MVISVTTGAPARRIGGGPTRSVAAASWTALGALLLRDLVVLRKHVWEFVLRTIIQPFLLCFVFLYVFPKIGQGIGGHGPAAQSAFATILVPGVVGISVMFQGVQSIALNMAQEFGFTREIEDRVQAPCPIWLVAMAKVLSGAAQGILVFDEELSSQNQTSADDRADDRQHRVRDHANPPTRAVVAGRHSCWPEADRLPRGGNEPILAPGKPRSTDLATHWARSAA